MDALALHGHLEEHQDRQHGRPQSISARFNRDVAEIMGVPQNTVKTRTFYARKRIAS